MQFFEFFAAEFTMFADGQASQSQRSIADAFELHDLMTDAGEESADFPVLTFGHRDFDPGAALLLFDGDNVMHAEPSLGEVQAAFQFIENLAGGITRDLCAVESKDAIAGMGESLRQVAIVGDDQQAGGIFVESSDGEQAGAIAGKQVEDAAATFGIVSGAEETGGLVEHEVFLPLNLQPLPIERDGLTPGFDCGAKLSDRLAVDRDASGSDQLFAFPARAQSRLSEETLQTHGSGGFGEFIRRAGHAAARWREKVKNLPIVAD